MVCLFLPTSFKIVTSSLKMRDSLSLSESTERRLAGITKRDKRMPEDLLEILRGFVSARSGRDGRGRGVRIVKAAKFQQVP